MNYLMLSVGVLTGSAGVFEILRGNFALGMSYVCFAAGDLFLSVVK